MPTSAGVAEIEEAVAQRFDALRARFADAIGADVHLAGALRRHVDGLQGGRLLDVGCGKGRFLPLWRSTGLDAVGLDRSDGMLRECAGVASRCRAPLVQASARRMPFADSTFDVVCAVDSVGHFPDFTGALAEMHRVLRPGGRLVLVDRNARSLDPVRPYLPGALVKRIDEWRGLWMYPREFVYRERWFRRSQLFGLLGGRFDHLQCDYVLSPEEAEGRWAWLFERVPAARRRLLVSGVKRTCSAAPPRLRAAL
jgi:ubiquinone/menaquinone biosynthesis C-methylase UbiE